MSQTSPPVLEIKKSNTILGILVKREKELKQNHSVFRKSYIMAIREELLDDYILGKKDEISF